MTMRRPGDHLDDELSGLLDGELSADETVAARTHLAGCAFCMAELAAIDRTRTLVRSLPAVDPPTSLLARAAAAPTDLDARPPARRAAVLASIVAAAAVLVVLLQWAPADRSVSPSLAGLVQAHATSVVNTDPADVAADQPPGVEAHVHIKGATGEAEFDVVPVVSRVPVAAKYTVTTAPGQPVADRPTIDVEVREQGVLAERIALDAETGVVLRRELYDVSGGVVRMALVERVRMTHTPAPTPAHRTAGGLVAAPSKLDGDYLRVGVYRRGRVVHMLFSDGLHALSVFAQAGALAASDLPGGGRLVRLGSKTGYHYDWPGGDVLLWESGGVVYTAVGDAPVEDVKAAAASMPQRSRLSIGERVRRRCRALAEAVTGG
ncbi:MAG: sigma-E factor negative regulatory protein RseB [Acidimicrobiaceae bacterium]|nr:sigma-E factor negative regulatory protein RseB [Acidimicrobiaceae bacterium]